MRRRHDMNQQQSQQLTAEEEDNYFSCPVCGERVDRRAREAVRVHHGHMLRPWTSPQTGRRGNYPAHVPSV